MSFTTRKISDRIIARTNFFYGYVVWGVATLGFMATSPGQSYSVSLFIDHFIEDFGLGRTTVSTLYGLGTFLASLSLTAVGVQIDRHGNRRVGILIASAFAVVLILISLVNGPVTLLLSFIAIRFLGQGSLSLVSGTTIAQWFWKRRGRMMSLTAVIYALFRSAYVPGLQRLLEVMDWRQVWVLLGVSVGVVMPALIWLFVHDRPEDLGLLPDGAEAHPAIPDQAGGGDATSDGDQEINWTLHEAMRTPIFWVFAGGRVIVPAWITGLVFHQISIFEELGYSDRTAAEMYGMMSLVTAGTAIAAGYLVDHVRPGVVMALQMTSLGVTMGTAMIMTEPWLLAIFALGYGWTLGSGTVFDGAVWTNLFGRKHQGAIRGFITTALVTGTAIGPILFGLSFDLLGSYNPVFGMGIALAMIPLLLSLLVKNPVYHPHEES